MHFSAVEAVIEMGKLAEKSSQCEDKPTVDENTGSNLLSLAAQIALEVEQITLSLFCFIDIRTAVNSVIFSTFSTSMYFMHFMHF